MEKFNFSVWLKTSSNPSDINLFRRHTGNLVVFNIKIPAVGTQRKTISKFECDIY